MCYWSKDYQDSDWICISEQISREKEQIKKLEMILSELKLKYKYTFVRKNNLIYNALIHFSILVSTFLLATRCFYNIFSMWLGYFLILFDIYLLVKEIKVITQLLLNCDVEIVSDFVSRHNLNTILNDRKNIEKQIQVIQLRIDEKNKKLMELNIQKDEFTNVQKNRNNILHKHGISLDNQHLESNLSLKKCGVLDSDVSDLYEYYILKERHLNEHLSNIVEELQNKDKEMLRLEDEFEKVKKKLLLFVIIFIFAIAIQNLFDRIDLLILIYIIFTVILIYYYRTCKNTIVMYLIEKESSLTKEYAFVNDIIPIKSKKRDLLKEKKQCEIEIAEIKKEIAKLVI